MFCTASIHPIQWWWSPAVECFPLNMHKSPQIETNANINLHSSDWTLFISFHHSCWSPNAKNTCKLNQSLQIAPRKHTEDTARWNIRNHRAHKHSCMHPIEATLRSDRKRWWEANLWGDTSSRISPCLHFRVQPEQRLAQSDRWSSISALLLSTSCYKLQKMRGFWHRAFASTAITHKLGDKPLQSTMDLILLTPRQFWWKLHSALPSLLVMLQLALCHSSKETVAKLWKEFF